MKAQEKRTVRVEELADGAVWRVVLATPKANILDSAKMRAIADVFARARDAADLRCIVLEGEGPHFSFGASVEEHLPKQFRDMLTTFHGLLEAMLEAGVFTAAAVRGQCLGAALEIVALCNRVFAAPGARLGQPEIRLGVLAPVASVALVERVGRGVAEDLCLTGRSLVAEEAHTAGLVDEIAEDPGAAALAFAKEHLLPLSGSSLRLANRAVRAGFKRRFHAELEAVERIYCDELMATEDAREGLAAFLEKREPRWRHR